MKVELLPSDTFWIHLNVIVLRENVGGTVRVFLNRFWVKWWRDRAQCNTDTRTHTQIETQIETQTVLERQPRNMTSEMDYTYKDWRGLETLLPGILCICLNIVLYQSLDFSVFWNTINHKYIKCCDCEAERCIVTKMNSHYCRIINEQHHVLQSWSLRIIMQVCVFMYFV